MKFMAYLRHIGAMMVFAILTACGGGGETGGGSTPAPTPTPAPVPVTATGSLTACTIEAGASKCPALASWSVTGISAAPSVYLNDALVSIGHTVTNMPIALDYGTNVLSIKDGTKLLFATQANVSCATGTSWNGTICAVPTTHYQDKVVAMVGLGYPHLVSNAPPYLVPAVNKTTHITGFHPLTQCGYADPSADHSLGGSPIVSKGKLADGALLIQCTNVSGIDVLLRYNLVANELTDYAGPVPSGMVFMKLAPGMRQATTSYGLWFYDNNGLNLTTTNGQTQLLLQESNVQYNGSANMRIMHTFSN